MAVNKVVYNRRTLIDLTADTVSKETLKKGFTAHQADGTMITGEFIGDDYDEIDRILTEGACPSYKSLFRRRERYQFDRSLWKIRCDLKPSHVGYFCIIPTLWLKKQVITGYFASIITKNVNGIQYTFKSEDGPALYFTAEK